MVLVVCSLLLAPTLAYRMCVDQGVFAYMGAEILEGRWPYLETWESDFPGLMFLQAVEILLFGKSIAMFRFFDLIFQLGNAYLIYRITCRVACRRGAYLAAAIFCLIYQGYGPWNTCQREGFGIFFILLGFWLYLTSDRRSTVATAAGIGLGLGLAATIKPTLLALAVFYLPLLLHMHRKVWKQILAALAGLVAPFASILIFYWALGGLSQLYEATVTYQSIYTMRLRGDDPLLFYWLSKLQRLGGLTVALLLLYGPFLLWGPARRERLMLFLGYLGTVYTVFVQGTFAGYHYLPGLGIGSILVGCMFSQTTTITLRDSSFRIGRARITTQLLLAHLVILAALPIYLKKEPIINLLSLHFLNRPLPNEYRNSTVFDFTEDFDVADYLQAHTQPDDRIQVWGYESLVYYLADRDAASRFQMTHPLVMRVPGQDITPMQRRWRQEFMHDMVQRQPRYVAVVQDDNWWWAPEERTSEELLNDFPEWKEFIQNNYVHEHTIGRFLIYRCLSPPQLMDTQTHRKAQS
jgi:hypothetical protein